MRLPRIRWAKLKCGFARPNSSRQLGLFGNSTLRTPEDFGRAVGEVAADCGTLIREIVVPFERRHIKKKSVALLDDISNRICTIADLSDCVRNMHPNAAFADAADQAMVRFTELVESLNTMPELYEAVRDSLTAEAHVLDELDRRTLQLFIDDFQQCGVHLEEAKENVLKGLIHSRHRLAQRVGFESYAHRAQKHTILGSYDAAVDFLYQKLRPLVDEELEAVRKLLVDHKRLAVGAEMSEWDMEVAGFVRRRQIFEQHGDLSRFLSLRNLLFGFESLCSALYGLHFEVRTPHAEEIWAGYVLRLEVFRNDSFLGTVYLDVESRKSKVQGVCHFTVRCSKLLDDATYQKPIVVLSLSIARHLGQPPIEAERLMDLVSFSPQQAENLFHEMGHAIHSMLGATRYQHVAGTRCPTDFAEVPSNLMEFFFTDRRVLSTFCREKHNPSASSFSEECAAAIHASLNTFPSLNVLQQLHYSLFDLRLHGDQAHSIAVLNSRSTTDLYLELGNELLPQVVRPRDFANHHRLTHLSTYGAKYYSYVIAKACASRIWLKYFAADPFDSAAGALRAKIQSFGGERPSKELLNMTLGHELTADDLSEALRLHCRP
ncbi:Mitochondrial intermediate peptidase [Aphelenchoides fujianensis]|nr:Mitochondrial intermediate peptidase [Aphelenchoides fujianensis]